MEMPYKNPEDKRQWRKRNRPVLREQDREWRKDHPEYTKNLRKKRREDKIKWYRNYKATLKCSRCPENHPACLQFHHIENNKKFTIGDVMRNKTIRQLMDEIAKCIVLCANCHAKEHYTNIS